MKPSRQIKRYLNPENTRRFLAKIKKTDTCWLWTAYTMPNGYGHFRIVPHSLYAHRIAYVLKHGEIPKGLDIDHLCRNRACVNPDHLEPVTRKENLLRGKTIPAAFAKRSKCMHGHSLKGGNVYHYRGYRSCRKCHAIRERKRRRSL